MGGSKSKVDAQSKGKDDAVEVRPTDPDLYSNYGGIQAYIAVKTDLVDKVLQEGYKCAKRTAVPCSFDPIVGITGLRRHEKDSDQTVLEVCGLEANIDREACCINTKLSDGTPGLEPKHLKRGTFMTRGAKEYEGVNCPICNKAIVDSADRGRVGNHTYISGGFKVVPCDNEECHGMQVERQQRLEKGRHLWLYHITDESSALLIQQAGGKMIRGKSGNVGGGIYFGTSPKDCITKTLHGADKSKQQLTGACLKCRVKVGDVLDQDSCTQMTFAKLIKQKKDTYWGTIGYTTKSYVVYSWDQVQVASRVNEDGTVYKE